MQSCSEKVPEVTSGIKLLCNKVFRVTYGGNGRQALVEWSCLRKADTKIMDCILLSENFSKRIRYKDHEMCPHL